MLKFNLILLSALLTGCMTQGSYQEQNTVHFANSNNSITETRTGTYQQMGMSGVSGAVAINGDKTAVLIHSNPQPFKRYTAHPVDNYRVYTDGNTSITRATIHPSACTQTYHRHGRKYTRNIPCPY